MARLPFPEPGRPELASTGRYLLWIARRQWGTLGLGFLWATIWMVAQGLVPAALGFAIGAAAAADYAGTLRAVGAVLLLGAVQTGAGVLRHRMAVTNWISAASRTQQLVVRHAADLGADLNRHVATGEVVTVTSSDVEQIGSAFDVAARFVGSVVAFLGVAVLLLTSSPMLGGLVLVGVPLLGLSIGPLLGPLQRREARRREQVGRASALAADTVAGLRVLRGIGGEAMFVDRFVQQSQRVRGAAVQVAQVRSILDSLQVALPGALLVAITWLGAREVVAGTLSVGELVAFYGYAAFLVIPLRTFTEAARRWTSAYVAARRIVTLLRITPTAPPATDATAPDFATSVVRDPSGLQLHPGRLVGVVCTDPAVAHRLLDHLQGGAGDGAAATVADLALPELDKQALRSAILVQDKDPALLSGTLRELFDVPRSGRVSIAQAIAASSAQDVLDAVVDTDPLTSDAMSARITERGRSLSGGQRQSLALARSLLVDPPVLVLDEPTNAVDAHTEARIADAVAQLRHGRTTVVLTSSPLLLDRCEEVVLLGPSGLLAAGRHRELLVTSDAYRAAVVREEVSAL